MFRYSDLDGGRDGDGASEGNGRAGLDLVNPEPSVDSCNRSRKRRKSPGMRGL